jgi:hypothetical protein
MLKYILGKYAECMAKCSDVISLVHTLNTKYSAPKVSDFIWNDFYITIGWGYSKLWCNDRYDQWTSRTITLEGNGGRILVEGWGGALRLRKQDLWKSLMVLNSLTDASTAWAQERLKSSLTNGPQVIFLHKYSNKTLFAGVAGVNSTFVDTDFFLCS